MRTTTWPLPPDTKDAGRISDYLRHSLYPALVSDSTTKIQEVAEYDSRYLKIDQTDEQTVLNGAPTFDGGLLTNGVYGLANATIEQYVDGTSAYMLRSASSDYSQLSLGLNTALGYTYIQSNAQGGGTTLPFTVWIGAAEKLRVAVDGTITMNGNQHTKGAAAPGSGAWLTGDICWNSAPSAGNPAGWMCSSGGAPGIWKAMGNLA